MFHNNRKKKKKKASDPELGEQRKMGWEIRSLAEKAAKLGALSKACCWRLWSSEELLVNCYSRPMGSAAGWLVFISLGNVMKLGLGVCEGRPAKWNEMPPYRAKPHPWGDSNRNRMKTSRGFFTFPFISSYKHYLQKLVGKSQKMLLKPSSSTTAECKKADWNLQDLHTSECLMSNPSLIGVFAKSSH